MNVFNYDSLNKQLEINEPEIFLLSLHPVIDKIDIKVTKLNRVLENIIISNYDKKYNSGIKCLLRRAKEYSKGYESYRNKFDENQCFTRSKTHIQDFMMKMTTIWFKWMYPTFQTTQDNPEHIQTRNQQDTESNHQWPTIDHQFGPSHTDNILDSQQADNESQGQTTSIAHKNLSRI